MLASGTPWQEREKCWRREWHLKQDTGTAGCDTVKTRDHQENELADSTIEASGSFIGTLPGR